VVGAWVSIVLSAQGLGPLAHRLRRAWGWEQTSEDRL